MKNIEIVNFVGNFEKVETVYTAKEANLQGNNTWTFTDLKEYNVSNNQTTSN
jgi:hypothetical protein